MVQLNNKCGHPLEWSFRLRGKGRTFTYCLGCLVEKTGLKNLESYDNDYINYNKEKGDTAPSRMASGERKDTVEKTSPKKNTKVR